MNTLLNLTGSNSYKLLRILHQANEPLTRSEITERYKTAGGFPMSVPPLLRKYTREGWLEKIEPGVFAWKR